MNPSVPPPLLIEAQMRPIPRPEDRGPLIGLVIVMVTFLLSGLAWIMFADNIPWADADFYFRGAKSLAEGRGYSHPFRSDHPPTAFHPIGYPWFLAHVWRLGGIDTQACNVSSWPELTGCGSMIQAGQVANLLLATVNIGLVFLLGWLIKGPRTAFLSSVIYALIPSRLFFTSALMSEEAFITAIMVALASLIIGVRRPGWALGAAIGFGLAIAAATFIRPLGIILLPLPLIMLFGKSSRPQAVLMQFGVAAVVVVLVLLPWTLRNHREVGGWNLVSNNGGINLWIGCHLNRDGGIASNGKWMDWWSGAAPQEINTLDERANDREAQELALACMREEPLAFVRLSLLKALYTFREDWEYVGKWAINRDLPDRPVSSIVSGDTEEAFGYLSNSVYLILLPLSVVGALSFFFSPSTFRGVIGAAFAALAIIPIAFFGDPRFHMPLFPMMSIWAAEAIFILAHGLRTAGTQHDEEPLKGSGPSQSFRWRQEPWIR